MIFSPLNRRGRTFATASFLCLFAQTSRGELSPDLQEAIDHLRLVQPRDWAFTHTVATGEFHQVQEVERYDPSNPPGEEWTLITHKGHAATIQENLDFQKRHTRRPPMRQPAASPPKPSASSPSRPPSLTVKNIFKNCKDEVVSETPETISYHIAGFFPHIQEPKPLPFLVRGMVHGVEKKLEETHLYADVVVSKTTKSVVSFHAWMPPFDKYIHEEVADVKFEIAIVDSRIPPQIVKTNTRVKAHALLGAFQIDEVKEETYSDFKKVLKSATVSVGDDQLIESDVLVPLTGGK